MFKKTLSYISGYRGISFSGRGGSSKTKKAHLQTAPSWEMRVDLGRKRYLPQILQTSLRHDTVIWTEEANQPDSTDGPMDR